MKDKISIVMPAYKKGSVIKGVLKGVCEVLDNTRWDYEIIVVQDGIFDNTESEVKSLKNKRIKVYGYKNNRGKGYAVRYGIARSVGDPIVLLDATKKINPNGLPLLLEHMYWYDADIMVASKRHPVSRVTYTTARRIYSFGYQMLIYVLFRLKIKDSQAGLKAYRRRVLEKVLPRMLVKQYAFDVELLAIAKYLGFKKIYESPVELSFKFDDGSRLTGKGLLFSNEFIRNMLVDTFAIFYRMYILGYYNDKNTRKWRYDKDLEMRINTGAYSGKQKL